jgi:Fic family protein
MIAGLSIYRVWEQRELYDRELELVRHAGRLESMLHPSAAEALRIALAGIHSYYSNLIEGPSTEPIEAELAAQKMLSPPVYTDNDDEKHALQAIAGIEAAIEMRLVVDDPTKSVSSIEFIRELHSSFISRLPDSMRIAHGENGTTRVVVPGQLRNDYVKVGNHIPPASERIETLLSGLDEAYRMYRTSPGAALLLHHRFAWIHPFFDGNGRVARLLTEAMLARTSAHGLGLWSLARGLAKRKDEYKQYLALADSPRRGDFDGRDTLSMAASTDFTKFMLDVAIDQAQFMSSRLTPDHLRDRLSRFFEEREMVLGADVRATALVSHALFYGPLERGAAGDLTGTSTRTAQSIVSDCLTDGLLRSPSPKGILTAGFPMYALGYLFPHLFPVDDPQRAMLEYRETKVATAGAIIRDRSSLGPR